MVSHDPGALRQYCQRGTVHRCGASVLLQGCQRSHRSAEPRLFRAGLSRLCRSAAPAHVQQTCPRGIVPQKKKRKFRYLAYRGSIEKFEQNRKQAKKHGLWPHPGSQFEPVQRVPASGKIQRLWHAATRSRPLLHGARQTRKMQRAHRPPRGKDRGIPFACAYRQRERFRPMPSRQPF